MPTEAGRRTAAKPARAAEAGLKSQAAIRQFRGKLRWVNPDLP